MEGIIKEKFERTRDFVEKVCGKISQRELDIAELFYQQGRLDATAELERKIGE
jgi:hypothetical protein